MGQVLQAGAGQAPARQAAVGAGIPKEIPADTINKVCASSIRAIEIADLMIRAGDHERRRHRRHGVDVERAVPACRRRASATGSGTARWSTTWSSTGSRRRSTGCTWSSRRRSSRASSGSRARSRTSGRTARTSARRRRRTRAASTTRSSRSATSPPTRAIRRDTTLEKLASLQPVFDPEGTTTAGNAPGRERRRLLRDRLLRGVRGAARPRAARDDPRAGLRRRRLRVSRADARARGRAGAREGRARRSTTSRASRSTRRSPRSRRTRRGCSAPTRRS